jgi:hypothetical protein
MTWHRFLSTTEDAINEKESGVEPPHSKVLGISHEIVGH